MSPISYTAWERDSTGNERVMPRVPDSRVEYSRPEQKYDYAVHPGAEVHPGAVFNLDYKREGGKWIVGDKETGIFGVGKKVQEAREDFRLAARQHLNVLERQEALSEELSWQLSYLRERVERLRL